LGEDLSPIFDGFPRQLAAMFPSITMRVSAGNRKLDITNIQKYRQKQYRKYRKTSSFAAQSTNTGRLFLHGIALWNDQIYLPDNWKFCSV